MMMGPDGQSKHYIKGPDGRKIEVNSPDGAKRMEADQPSKSISDGKKNAKKGEQQAVVAPRPLDVDAAIREVFLRTVSRPPTPEEFAAGQEEVAAAETPIDGIRDLLWTMLNTREFMVNH